MTQRPTFRSHLWPRTASGRRFLLAYVGVSLLAQPPIVLLANRIAPPLLSMPFLYAWLAGVYGAMIVVLICAWRRGL